MKHFEVVAVAGDGGVVDVVLSMKVIVAVVVVVVGLLIVISVD